MRLHSTIALIAVAAAASSTGCTGFAVSGPDAAGPSNDAGLNAGVDAGNGTDAGPDAGAGGADSGSPSHDAGSSADAGPVDGGAASDIPPGQLLFAEPFDDGSLQARGWYDTAGVDISASEVSPGGGAGSFECAFAQGATRCSGGVPARHRIDAGTSVYLRLKLKFGDEWVGSGQAYHPHMFHFTTSADDDWVGPARSHLTLYVEVVGGRPMVALQDSLNVDGNCILRNDDSFVGCGGDFATYPFTEARSVAACNGLAGDVDARDCFNTGSYWYSARAWDTSAPWFTDAAGPRAKSAWHTLEAYFALNSIQGGRGVPDGKLRLRLDGQTVVASDRVLFRTAANPDMRFTHFLMLPYIGDGSPVPQRFWVDELVVGTGAVP